MTKDIDDERAAIAQQVADYLANGGTITVLPSYTETNHRQIKPARVSSGPGGAND